MLVHANIEAVWVVIIIVSVIAQVVKGARKAASQAAAKNQRPPPVPPGARRQPAAQPAHDRHRDYVAPETALQDFLRNLTGEPPPTPTQRPGAHTPSPSTRLQSPRQPAGMPTVAGKRTTHTPTPAVVLESTSPEGTSDLDGAIKREMRDRQAIRKAIVMREILGPPLALR